MFYIFAIMLSLTFQPQTADPFSGVWEGELTHEGGFSDSYSFKLILEKEGDHYVGSSVVKVQDIWAEMGVSGEALSEQFLIIKDTEVIRFEIKDGMEWCMKSYQLVLTTEDNVPVIKGSWQGKTSFSDCIPGTLTLRRAQERA